MAAASVQLFDVVLASNEREHIIGRVEADPSFELKIVTALDKHRPFLEETVQEMNKKDLMHVEVAPPEGSPKFTLYSRAVTRTEAEFLTELLSYLKKYYDLTLRPVSKS